MCAEDEETNGAFCPAQGSLPTTGQPTGGEGDGDKQSHLTGLGELLSNRSIESLFLADTKRGRNEDPAAYDAGQTAPRKGMEAVEERVDLSRARPIQRL